ncbi:MAG: alkaline phosphatase [Thermoanaerobaculia bacterium]
MKTLASERPPGGPSRRMASGPIVVAATAGIALGMALGVVVGDRMVAAASRKSEVERLPIPVLTVPGTASVAEPPTLAERPVRNIVLLIGDGMGLAQIAAGRILAKGTEGRLHFERFPTVGLVTTHPAAAVVTMSDAAASSLATGTKVEIGRISTDEAGRPLPTLLEVLRDSGWATGMATTTRITDATPAAFAAHVPSRRDEARIAEQLSEARVDLLIGGGRSYFLPHKSTLGRHQAGRDLLAEMRQRGVEVVDDASGLEGATRLPTAALFGREPQQTNPRSPTVEAMASKALELLSQSGRPFFLLLEEEEIDTAAHANDGRRMSAALVRFDDAAAAAAAFAARDGETLVVVLGDHATGGLTIDSRSRAGELALLWGSREHTGEPVPVFAYGPPAAAARFSGMHDNTEIPHLVAAALGFEFPRPVATQ